MKILFYLTITVAVLKVTTVAWAAAIMQPQFEVVQLSLHTVLKRQFKMT